jgi:hypothetical protein
MFNVLIAFTETGLYFYLQRISTELMRNGKSQKLHVGNSYSPEWKIFIKIFCGAD